jgi:hypothetical protein
MTLPPGWRMELFEVVPRLLIGTRLASGTDYATLGVDVIVDLEDWEWAWVPTVPIGKMYLRFPMADEDEVDPKTRDVAHFIASLISSGRTVLVHCTEGLNRPRVVAARALMVMGRTAADAIGLVRHRRGLTWTGSRRWGTRHSSNGSLRKRQHRIPTAARPSEHRGSTTLSIRGRRPMDVEKKTVAPSS